MELPIPIDSTGYPDMDIATYKTLCEKYTTENINARLIELIKDRFPYKSMNLGLDRVKDMIRNMWDYRPRFVTRPYRIGNLDYKISDLKFYNPWNKTSKQTVLINFIEYYSAYNVSVDYWHDPIRMTARRLDSPSAPIDVWKNETIRFIDYAVEHYPRINSLHLREAAYEVCREATEFKPSIMAGLIQFFKARRILDFSAGRGARLLGAIAKRVDLYVGVDPDERLFSGYLNMIETLVPPKERYRFKMICAPFQKLDEGTISDSQFDMVFTSPPYFNLEHYSDSQSQSDVEFPTLDTWFNGFLMPSAIKAWNLLGSNGFLIINLNDPGRSMTDRPRFTERFVDTFNKWLDEKNVSKDQKDQSSKGHYLGVIAYAECYGEPDPNNPGQRLPNVDPIHDALRAPQPMWIWRKFR